jgi:ABC-2 type transport system permease protein
MFKQLVNFEAYYQLKQRAFLLFALLFLLLGFFVGGQGYAPTNVNFNSNYQVFFNISLFTLGCVFIIMFFVITAVLRDKQFQMESLIFSSSIKKQQFFWSRFLGVFLFSIIAFSPYLIGYALGVTFSNLDPERVASFNLLAYVQPWFYMVIPNIFICSTFIFSISILTKNSTATYISAIFIYMIYMISSIYMNSPLLAQAVPSSPESMAMASIADPFGIAAFFEQTQYWTPYQKNTELISFSGLFMWNRVIWMLFSSAIMGVTYLGFSFRKMSQKVKKKTIIKPIKNKIIPYKTIIVSNSLKSNVKAFISLVKIELNGMFKRLPFIAVMLMLIFTVFSEFYANLFNGGEYNTSSYPFTNLLIELIEDPLNIFGLILIIFYSAELIWRERSYNFNLIIDATPTSNSIFFLSKFVSLLLLPILMILSGIAMAIGFQLVLGYHNFEFNLYLSLFYHNGIQFIVFSMVGMFIHSFAKNKYLGMGIFGLIVLVTLKSSLIGLEHPLLSLGSMPRVNYSNMNGFSGSSKLFNHLSIYWISFGIIVTLLSFKVWKRGIISNLKHQINILTTHSKKGQIIVASFFSIVFVTSGATIYYNTNVVSEYITQNDQLYIREQYERIYKKYERLEKPYTIAMKTEMAIFPNEEKYSVKGNYVLLHKGKNPIKQLLVTERVPLLKIAIERATLIKHDSIYGTYIFQFDKPIKPNEKLNFSFEIVKEKKGYVVDQTIVKNGTYITHRDFEPYIGYRSAIEISNDYERQKRGLPKRTVDDQTDSHIALKDEKEGRINYETIISTQQDQIALASGDLVNKWQKDSRNYYHYKSESKILPMLGYFSARYATKFSSFDGIEIEQYFDPNHKYNVESIEKSIKETLAYCTENFGVYPFNHIRVAEVPSHWSFGGFAHPGMISMVEDRLYLTDLRDTTSFNLAAKRTIHEVAHQWWGHILSPKIVAGGSIFVEGFAQYTEGVVLEKMYGKGVLYKLSERARSTYFSGRSFANKMEPPIYKVLGEGYISYGKAYTVMMALRVLIGEDKLNQVLRVISDKHRNHNNFEANTIELLEELYKATPIQYHTLINDWFKRIITYDIGITQSSYKKIENGTYEVSVQIKAKRMETLVSREKKEIAINEPITIGVFAKHPENVTDESSILYLKPLLVNKNEINFKVIVKELPKYIAIDPYGTRSDENLVDNIARL